MGREKGQSGKIKFVSLGKLIRSGISRDGLNAMLSSFSCKMDLQIQNFLRKEAVAYEEKGKTRTYLCFVGDLELVGYFTLTIRSVVTTIDIEKNKDGERFCKYLSPFTPAYLLVLTAKDDEKYRRFCTKPFFDAVIPQVLRTVRSAKDKVGGEILYLDCTKDLQRVYGEYGFEYFQDNPDNVNNIDRADDLFQMMRVV